MANKRPRQSYTQSYYMPEGPADNLESARIVVPIVCSLVKPSSVVDVGCGSGAWLSAFLDNGVKRVLGLDGENVDPSWLTISKDNFRSIDLGRRFDIGERFDLAVCLEVAEHLHRNASSEFIESLVKLAPVILFSGAVPRQGGIHHVNEQWPDFWTALFKKKGYSALDVIRKDIWQNPAVKYWYRQNIFLYVHSDLIHANEHFAHALHFSDDMMLIQKTIFERQRNLRPLLKALPKAILKAARTLLRD